MKNAEADSSLNILHLLFCTEHFLLSSVPSVSSVAKKELPTGVKL
jgi:hypothetical protein